MTIAEVLGWQDRIDPTSISEAAGRYQILEDTLRRLVQTYAIDPGRLFDAAAQDELAGYLLSEAGWDEWRSGALSSRGFGDELALIWAAFPRLSGPKRGRSEYHGLAGNRARASVEAIETVLANPDDTSLVQSIITSMGGPPSGAARAVLQPPPQKARLATSRVRAWSRDPFYSD